VFAIDSAAAAGPHFWHLVKSCLAARVVIGFLRSFRSATRSDHADRNSGVSSSSGISTSRAVGFLPPVLAGFFPSDSDATFSFLFLVPCSLFLVPLGRARAGKSGVGFACPTRGAREADAALSCPGTPERNKEQGTRNKEQERKGRVGIGRKEAS